MKIVRVMIVAMVLAGSGFWANSSAGKPPAPAPSLREQMIGTWKLESRTVKKPDGSVSPLPGWDKAVGYITYDRTGFMSLQFMQLDRTKESGTSSYVAYFGPYTVDEATKTVTHHHTGDLNPDGVAASQPREVVLEGDKLSLNIRTANSPNVNVNSFTRMK
jgi:hypothetical protein